jgi:hypothetical protein
MELMIKNGTANLNTTGKFELPCGLHCSLLMAQETDKPINYVIEFMVDSIKFANWLDSPEIKWMLSSGPLLFNTQGFRVAITQNSLRQSLQDVSWFIDSPNGAILFPIMERPARFHVHRDVLSGVEWEVMLEESGS